MNKLYYEFQPKEGLKYAHLIRCPASKYSIKSALESIVADNRGVEYVYVGQYEEQIKETPKRYCIDCHKEIGCFDDNICDSCKLERSRCDYDENKICNGCMDC